MEPIRRHGVPDTANRIERPTQRRIQRHRGVQQEVPVSEADHGHAGPDFEPVEPLGPLYNPDGRGQLA